MGMEKKDLIFLGAAMLLAQRRNEIREASVAPEIRTAVDIAKKLYEHVTKTLEADLGGLPMLPTE